MGTAVTIGVVAVIWGVQRWWSAARVARGAGRTARTWNEYERGEVMGIREFTAEELKSTLAEQIDVVLASADAPLSAEEAIDPYRIVGDIARRYGLTIDDLLGREQYKEIRIARQDLYYALQQILHWTTIRIARFVGGRDHSSIVTSLRRRRARLAKAAAVAADRAEEAEERPSLQ